MQTQPRHIVGIIAGLVFAVIDFLLYFESPYFIPLLVVAVSIAWAQYWLDFFIENTRQRNIERMFPEFVRALVSAIKSGMPVSRAILHVAEADFGDLTPYVKKLAYQVEWNIPIHKALLLFGDATGNKIIKRALATVIEAETSGGNIEDVLDSITHSLVEIKKIKEKRRAAVHSQIVQNYIIFFIFLGVIVTIQNMLIPYVLNLQGAQFGSSDILAPMESTIVQSVPIDVSSLGAFVFSLGGWFMSLNGIFLMLAVVQGFFAGLVIGKLSEGNLKYGVKHSLILVTATLIIMSLAQGFIPTLS
ncbi:type II secretion system F family protein [Candidatus Woesearchaeota archaeon]|nr:type II secretion system F family protein [Candidatus Woesearchaeota archaeon]